MEDAPRKKNEDEEILPRPSLDSQDQNERRLNIWRKFGIGRLETSRKKGIEENKDDEDADDEDDDADTMKNHGKSRAENNSENWVYSRYLRIRKKIRPILPVLEKIKDSNDKNKHEASRDIKETKGSVSTTTESIYAEISTNPESSEEKIEATISTSVDIEKETSEPESLEDILRKRKLNNEFIQQTNSIKNDNLHSKSSSVDNLAVQRSEVSVRKTSTIDKYIEKKKQQKMMSKLIEKDLKRVDKAQDKLRKELEAKIDESEKQHLILQKNLERQVTDANQQISKKEIGLNNNNKNESLSKINTMYETKPTMINDLDIDPRQKMISESRKEIDRISHFENTVKHVESLKKSRIENEFAFERRHEVKDEPQSTVSNKFIPLARSDRLAMEKSIQQSQDVQNMYNKKSFNRIATNIINSPDAVQAAQTGVVGAVVGVVIFLLIYVLS
jgi:hypothetical protein